MIKDLRVWLDDVEKLGELSYIQGAHWNQEIGCITEMNRKKPAPALLFDNIEGYPSGYRVLTGSLKSPERVSLTLNLPLAHTDAELSALLLDKLSQWEENVTAFPAREVADGPVLENIHSGKNIDVLEFPVPKWHPRDGGRYIGTGDAVITRDPETGVVNLGAYRVMVHDKNTCSLSVTSGQHGRIHYEKFHKNGEPCPVAVSLGHHPLFFGVAALSLTASEYAVAGAIRGTPVEVIREEVTGLPVPADSEIVIAGWCPPNKMKAEGPFGEWVGYYASLEAPKPVIEVERIYHRNSPVILGSPPARPPSDSSYFMGLVSGAMLHRELIRSGIPDVKAVGVSETAGRLFVVISLKQRYAGHAKQAAFIANQSPMAFWGRFVVVVDEDINPFNLDEVLWAICTRCDPEKNIDIVRRCRSSPLDTTIRKPAAVYFNSRAVIDACKPFEWFDEFPVEVKTDPQVVQKVKEKWPVLMTKLQ